MIRVALIIFVFFFSCTKAVVSSELDKMDILPATTIIVKSDSAGSYEKKAASVLQRYLRKIYGSKDGFRIVSEARIKENKGVAFAIGRTRVADIRKLDSLAPYSFYIRSENRVISICGSKPIATLIAVGYFLDHFCGVRFYMPSELFITTSCQTPLAISNNLDITETPYTPYVMGTGFGTEVKGEQLFAELNGLVRKDWGSHEHTMSERFPPEKFADKYPDIFPIYNGKKYLPVSPQDQNWQPDFSEPTLVDAAVNSAVDYFKTNPGINHIAFSVQDGGRFTTKGENDLVKISDREEKMEVYTRMFLRFLNQTAEKLDLELKKHGIEEKKTIVYLSYSKVKLLPEEKLHPSILPVTVYRIAESKILDLYGEGDKNALFKPKEWAGITNRIGHHDWAQGNGYLVPRIYTHAWQEYLKQLEKNQLQFEYAHLECYPNWGLDGPKYYYLSKLLWNPDINLDSIQRQFCSDMFGSASQSMESYFQTLEELTISMNNQQQRKKMWKFQHQLMLTREEMDLVMKAKKYLDVALSCKLSKEEYERIDLFYRSFSFSEQLFKIINTDINVDKVAFKEFVRKDILSDPYTLYLSRSIKGEDKLMNILNQILKE